MKFSPHMANMARHDEQQVASYQACEWTLLVFTAEVLRFCANSAHLEAASASSISWEFKPGGFPSHVSMPLP